MRTFKLIGTVLMTTMLGSIIAACSNDDTDNENGNGTVNSKKLMKITSSYDDGETDVISFHYDSKGRLASSTERSRSDNEEYVMNVTWGNNAVSTSYENENSDRVTYTLNNGLIKESNDEEGWGESYIYNSEKQLTQIKGYGREASDTYSYTYTWENGKAMRIDYQENASNEDAETYTFTYSGKTCKGWCPNPDSELLEAIEEEPLFLAHPELTGLHTNQLPDKCYIESVYIQEYPNSILGETCKQTDRYEEFIEYRYKLDKEGYVEEVIVNNKEVTTTEYSFIDKNADGIISDDERDISNSSSSNSTAIYTFQWE